VTTSPGKRSAHISTPAFTVPGIGEKLVATVTPLNARKGDILEVEGLLAVYAPDDGAMYVLLRANGATVYGTDPAQDCRGEVACSVVAVGWLDLDEAEKAHPGLFNGKPVTVEMIAVNGRVTVPSATATLRARLLDAR
jgi:hypothetical protein